VSDFAAKESRQWDCVRLDFEVPGGRGFVILPARPAREKDQPWIWYAPTFIVAPSPLPKELHAWYMTRWLGAGIAIGGVDVGEAWGNPAGRAGFTEYHRAAVRQFHLDEKACLLGQSRGGLFVYNWAAEHPRHVRCIGGIYPVCNLRIAAVQEKVCAAYGLPMKQLLAQAAQHNPLDRLAPLAKAGVPLFHIHGDVDKVVPLEDHSGELARRYRDLGGRIELLVVPGKGHEEVVEYFQCPAVLDFFLREALAR
jgi:pimeloyl-ACP methyl ester carboxylesterase